MGLAALVSAGVLAASTSGSLLPERHGCPAGYYRDAPIVFKCGGSSGSSRVLIAPGPVRSLAGVPRGTSMFQVDLLSNYDMNLTIYAARIGQYLVKADHGRLNDQHLVGTFEGTDVRYSGSDNSIPVHEWFAFRALTPMVLDVGVKSGAISWAECTLQYSFIQVANCLEPPVGCKHYDSVASRDTVDRWSLWARQRFPGGASNAWRILRQPVTISNIVQYDDWIGVWDQWLDASFQPVNWQAAYHFFDRDGNEGVSEAEFFRGFGLHATQRSVAECSTGWRTDFSNDHKAWLAFTGAAVASVNSSSTRDGISRADWGPQVWSNCRENGGGPQASSGDSFAYIDTNDDGFVAKKEFIRAWNSPNECPFGYYRTSPIVFNCDGSAGQNLFSIGPQETKDVSVIPAGVKDLKIGVRADVDIDVWLWDKVANLYVVRWEGGVLNRDQIVGSYKGGNLRFSGDDASNPVHEFVTFTSPTMTSLILQVNNQAPKQTSASVVYSYSGINPCPKVPAGCVHYDVHAARHVATQWSCWLSSTFPTPTVAWDDVAGQNRQEGNDNAVEFHSWGSGVWEKWPSSHGSPETSHWQQAFHYMDIDNSQLIDREEFTRAYNLCTTRKSLRMFCTDLSTSFVNVDVAWANKANGARSIAYTLWDLTVWSLWPGTLKASWGDSFYMIDEDNDLSVDYGEFKGCFTGTLFLPYKPKPISTTPTTTTSTILPTTTTTTTTVYVPLFQVGDIVHIRHSNAVTVGKVVTVTGPNGEQGYAVVDWPERKGWVGRQTELQKVGVWLLNTTTPTPATTSSSTAPALQAKQSPHLSLGHPGTLGKPLATPATTSSSTAPALQAKQAPHLSVGHPGTLGKPLVTATTAMPTSNWLLPSTTPPPSGMGSGSIILLVLLGLLCLAATVAAVCWHIQEHQMGKKKFRGLVMSADSEPSRREMSREYLPVSQIQPVETELSPIPETASSPPTYSGEGGLRQPHLVLPAAPQQPWVATPLGLGPAGPRPLRTQAPVMTDQMLSFDLRTVPSTASYAPPPMTPPMNLQHPQLIQPQLSRSYSETTFHLERDPRFPQREMITTFIPDGSAAPQQRSLSPASLRPIVEGILPLMQRDPAASALSPSRSFEFNGGAPMRVTTQMPTEGGVPTISTQMPREGGAPMRAPPPVTIHSASQALAQAAASDPGSRQERMPDPSLVGHRNRALLEALVDEFAPHGDNHPRAPLGTHLPI